MQLAAIIPSRCLKMNLPYLSSCVDSLKKAVYKEVELKIIVVSENPYGRKTVKKLKIDEYCFSKKGSGFSGMNNSGIEKAFEKNQPDYFLFINDDAWVSQNFFKTFLSVVKRENPDVVIPLVYNSLKTKIDSFGIEYFASGFSKTANNLRITTSLASGSCFLAKSTLLKGLKKKFGYYFNPIFYYYMEDVEFSVRVRSLDAKFIRSRSLVAYHYGSVSSGNESYFKHFYAYRNLIWVILLTWPTKIIFNNLFKILIFQGILILWLTSKFGIKIYPHILFSTLTNLKKIFLLRKTTIGSYNKGFIFDTILNSHILRSKNDKYY